jgi:superoxide dismutase, Fe-Mn family
VAIELTDLPYGMNALSPHISEEAVRFHFGRVHRSYVDRLNALVAGTEFEKSSLEYIVRKAKGEIFDHAAQVWNHAFYWNSLSPDGGGCPGGDVLEAIRMSFGSFAAFQKDFNEKAIGLNGSGWVWLLERSDSKLAVVTASDAATPLMGADKPLLACDVCEHAYSIDYRDAKPKYIEAWWALVNWDFAEENFD